jgi:hypothetical protein
MQEVEAVLHLREAQRAVVRRVVEIVRLDPARVAVGVAFAWIETKRSAPSAFARAVRSFSDSVSSASRVSTTSAPSFVRSRRRRRARRRASSPSPREALRPGDRRRHGPGSRTILGRAPGFRARRAVAPVSVSGA